MRRLTLWLGFWPAFFSSMACAELHVVVIEGLGGETRYAEQFARQVTAIENASRTLTLPARIRVFRADEVSRETVLAHFEALRTLLKESDQLAIYLIGHGSYDEHDYKFNIKGPDLTGSDFADVLATLPGSNQLLVDTSSSSGAIADLLNNNERLLVLATRSGAERHATRFGEHFATALADPTADTDKNQIITADEAFRYAQRQVDDYFERNAQLSTEHARIEGPRADRFALARLRAVSAARSEDRELEELTRTRDALNASIDALRLARETLTAEEYRASLLEQMLELARLEDAIERREQDIAGDD